MQPQIGLTFASLLRSILRQDPDVIMVGEIRDGETAQIAVQAALTGHLVLSTLHTNSAAAAVTRLRDMGVEDYLLTAVLRGVHGAAAGAPAVPDCRQAGAGAARTGRAVRARPVRRGTGRSCCSMPSAAPPAARPAIAAAPRSPSSWSSDAEIERLIFSRADHTTIERAAVAAGYGSDVRCRPRRRAGRRDDDRGSHPQHPGGCMTTFRYTAIGAGGERLAGMMDAATEAEVIARLQRQGAMPVRAEPADTPARWLRR